MEYGCVQYSDAISSARSGAYLARRYDEAMREYAAAEAQFGRKTWQQRGYTLIAMGRAAEAVEMFREACGASSAPWNHRSLSWALAAAGEPAAARTELAQLHQREENEYVSESRPPTPHSANWTGVSSMCNGSATSAWHGSPVRMRRTSTSSGAIPASTRSQGRSAASAEEHRSQVGAVGGSLERTKRCELPPTPRGADRQTGIVRYRRRACRQAVVRAC